MIKCSKCGFLSNHEALICPSCGSSSSKTIKIDPNKVSKSRALSTASKQNPPPDQSVTAGNPTPPTRTSNTLPLNVPPGAKFCMECGSLTRPSSKVPGSVGNELIILFLSFGSCVIGLLIPILMILAIGLFIGFVGYGIWRLTNRNEICSHCGKGRLIPATSPVALQMITKIKRDLSAD